MNRMTFLLFTFLLFNPLSYAADIHVATYEWPPYNYSENGIIKGISTEIVKEILKKAQITADFTSYPWVRAKMMADTQKNILIYTIRRIPEREGRYKWVGPITPPSSSNLYKLKKRDDIIIRSLSDARQYVIGVIRDDSMHQYLLNRNFVKGRNLDVAHDELNNIKKLFFDRIDLIVWTELTLPIKIKTAGYSIKQLEKVFVLWEDKEGYYAAFSRETDDVFVEKARIALEQIRHEGMIESVAAKYLKNMGVMVK